MENNKNFDFQNYGYGSYDSQDDIFKDQLYNPMYQYEQAYMYYRSLCMQMDYKLKCKEYENICSKNNIKPN